MSVYFHILVRLNDCPAGDLGGERAASVGIDVQAPRPASSRERGRIDYGMNDGDPAALNVALGVLRLLAPTVVPFGEEARVLHDRENARIILSVVPRDSGDAYPVSVHGEYLWRFLSREGL